MADLLPLPLLCATLSLALSNPTTADTLSQPPPTIERAQAKMAKIPAGNLPVEESNRSITIPPFSLARTELTWNEWAKVRNWALQHGYEFGQGHAQSPDHPVSTITWYDAIKFCNAASELAGLTPAYYLSGKHDEVYRKGEADLTDDCLKAGADGYRLPTEWEWEYACRAGTTSLYYYGDQSDPSPQNPYAWHIDALGRGDDVSPHPVGLKKPNAFELYDMSGNIAEWCWDRFRNDKQWRVQRGGSVALDNDVTSSFRSPVPPDYRIFDAGLRLASTSRQCPPLAEVIAAKQLTMPVSIEPLHLSYKAQDDAVVAAKLVRLLNPDAPGMDKIVALQSAGKATEALAAYRDHLAAHLRATPSMQNNAPKSAEEINKWFAEVEGHATRAKVAFDNLNNAGRAQDNSYHAPVAWNFGMGFGGYNDQWFRIMSQLVAALPADSNDFSILPARAVANMVIFVATDDISKPIKDPRNCVGNQQVDTAKALIDLSRRLPEFRDAPAWSELGIERLKTGALARFILPDGGDLEQSFNYNAGLFTAVKSITELFNGQPLPDWITQMHESAINRARMFAVLRLASGANPSVGNNCYGRDMPQTLEDIGKKTDPFYDPLVEQITDHLIFNRKKNLPVPAFTSIALPYSGYYMMRDGWDQKSSSLFFKSSRPGAGHNHPDNNSIELCAYGRHLLVDREAAPYNADHLPEKQRKDVMWIWEYKSDHEKWTANTLLIDGCGQKQGVNNLGYKTTIPNQPWYSSPTLDFVQGSWSRIYTSGMPMNSEKVREMAAKYDATPEEIAAQLAAVEKMNALPQDKFEGTHTRQVIYLKAVNAWIVTDRAARLDNQPARSLTQLWHLPAPHLEKSGGYGKKYDGFSPLFPGFEKEHVQADEASGQIITTNPENVNLAILHAAPSGVKYALHFGEKYPYRGWANAKPSMVSGYLPAMDIEATFPAGVPVITVLVPIPQGETLKDRVAAFERKSAGTTSSIQLRFTDGTEVDYTVAENQAALHAGPAKAKTESLLAMTRGGKTTGLAISRGADSYAFDVTNAKMQRTESVTSPTGFTWQNTPEGIIPSYTTVKPPVVSHQIGLEAKELK